MLTITLLFPDARSQKEIYSGQNYIAYYSLARNTDISAEIYPYHKMIIMGEGEAFVYALEKTILFNNMSEDEIRSCLKELRSQEKIIRKAPSFFMPEIRQTGWDLY